MSVHSSGVPGPPLRPPRWRVLLLLLARLLSSMVTTLASMEQLAPAALGSLMQSHLVLRQHADALAGSSELARAYRAWAALAKLRRQVEWLGLHLQEWRMQQLQQESWLSEAKQVLHAVHEEAVAAASAPPTPQHLHALEQLMAIGFTREASIVALRDADGSLEYAAEALLEDAEESGLLQFLPAATVDAARALAHAATGTTPSAS